MFAMLLFTMLMFTNKYIYIYYHAYNQYILTVRRHSPKVHTKYSLGVYSTFWKYIVPSTGTPEEYAVRPEVLGVLLIVLHETSATSMDSFEVRGVLAWSPDRTAGESRPALEKSPEHC